MDITLDVQQEITYNGGMNHDKYAHFDIEKVIQVFAYIQKQAGITDKLQLVKYLFFADRLHLRRHLHFISKDRYFALKYGPAASASLNVLNKEEDWLNAPSSLLNDLLKKVEIRGTERIFSETATSLLSKNELDSLNYIIETFKDKEPFVVDISHEYPEWKQYADIIAQEVTPGHEIGMDCFFSNPHLDNSPKLKELFGKDPFYERESYLTEAKNAYHAMRTL